MPRVSIIMNCLNGERYLKEAIDSVFAQTYPDWEIVFWDNASTDNSPAIAKSFGIKVKYFRSDKTTSLGEARNEAISVASGEFITFLDYDDLWEPDKLAQQIALIDKDPKIGFIYTNFIIWNTIANTRHKALPGPMPSGNIFREMLRDYRVGLLTTMIRKSVLDSTKSLFDITLTHASDYELFLRILFATKAAYLEDTLAVYRLHSAMYSMRTYNNNQNEIRYVLNKLSGIIPDFYANYANELKTVNEKLEYSEIWMKLLKGERNDIRRRAYVLKTYNFRLVSLYLTSFLPQGLWMTLWNVWGTLKGNKEAKQIILKDLKKTT